MNPRVTDNDQGEITVTLDGKELRGWSYKNDGERRTKMLLAREYVESSGLANYEPGNAGKGADTLAELCAAFDEERYEELHDMERRANRRAGEEMVRVTRRAGHGTRRNYDPEDRDD